MGVIKFGVKDAVGNVETGGNFYDVAKNGLPPVGTYRGVIKRLELKKSGPKAKTPGTPMLNYLFEIKEPKGSKLEKYNGYGIFGNQMITDQGKGRLNQMLNAIAGSEEAGLKLQKMFWLQGVVLKGKEELGHIQKIGTFNVKSPECELKVAVSTRKKKTSKEYPEPGLDVASFLMTVGADDDDEDIEGVEDETGQDNFEDFSDVDVDDDDGEAEDADAESEEADVDGDVEEASDADDDAGDDGEDLDGEAGDLDGEDDSISEELDEDLDDDLDGGEEDQQAALKERLADITELKVIRLLARDEFDIPAPATKGKSVEDVADMILAKDAAGGSANKGDSEPPF